MDLESADKAELCGVEKGKRLLRCWTSELVTSGMNGSLKVGALRVWPKEISWDKGLPLMADVGLDIELVTVRDVHPEAVDNIENAGEEELGMGVPLRGRVG